MVVVEAWVYGWDEDRASKGMSAAWRCCFKAGFAGQKQHTDKIIILPNIAWVKAEWEDGHVHEILDMTVERYKKTFEMHPKTYVPIEPVKVDEDKEVAETESNKWKPGVLLKRPSRARFPPPKKMKSRRAARAPAAGKIGLNQRVHINTGEEAFVRSKSDRAACGLWQVVVVQADGTASAKCQVRKDAKPIDEGKTAVDICFDLLEMLQTGACAVDDLLKQKDRMLQPRPAAPAAPTAPAREGPMVCTGHAEQPGMICHPCS